MNWTQDMVDAHNHRLKNGKGADQTPAATVVAKAKDFDPWQAMNLTEQRYVTEKLDPGKTLGKILSWAFEPITLHLVKNEDKMDYDPDFLVVTTDGRIEFHEIKGKQIWEDSILKFKMAMELYPFFYWYMWQWKDNQWKLKKTNDHETKKTVKKTK